MLRVAVVGSGPSGLYAAEALTRRLGAGEVTVDVLDQLPAPYGLVRYGVAPDHLTIKSIAASLAKVFEHPGVRFLGNVRVGVDLSLEDLREHYDAVVYAFGAALDRRIGIPGEDLAGVFSATDFVAWYSGHPDAAVDRFTLDARAVAVIGVGNVAVDVARILVKDVAALRTTDLPDHVLDVLTASRVQDVYVVGRRGAGQAKFTTKELRELGELDGVDVVVDPAELVLDEASAAVVAADRALRRNLDVLTEWASRPLADAPRRLHLRFLLRPAQVLGSERVDALEFERTAYDGAGGVRGTGSPVVLPVDMVVRSVGYRGQGLPGVPFDESAGVVPNAAGRVLRDGTPAPAEYVVGWIKRGPTGLIGTNKSDAAETVGLLLEDLPGLLPAPVREPDAVPALLAARGVHVVTWAGWRAIEAAEAELGRAQGRDRIKIADRAALLAAAAAPETLLANKGEASRRP